MVISIVMFCSSTTEGVACGVGWPEAGVVPVLPPERAPQQLRDCLRAPLRAGQFVSGGREANLINASPTTPISALA